MNYKRIFSLFLAALLTLSPIPASAVGSEEPPSAPEGLSAPPEVTYDPIPTDTDPIPDSSVKSALLMDAETGQILWGREPDTQREPASVTKVMTMLLVCEALDEGTLQPDQMVTASAHAAEMGGSQIFLKEGEQMTVTDLLKAVAVVSGNDAAVALAEAVAGTETAFVERMNQRAIQLGMEQTHFVNCTGLPVEGHLTTAHDIAIMSRELLSHDRIREFTSIWMDSLRDGEFALSSTNKLLKSYDGCTGLKTGYTSAAGHCISASARRDDRELIAVVLGAADSKERFSTAASLLDWGFASFRSLTVTPDGPIAPIPVTLGKQPEVSVKVPSVTLLLRAGDEGKVTTEVELLPTLDAPVTTEDIVGQMIVKVDGAVAAVLPLNPTQSVEKLDFQGTFVAFLKNLFSCQW